MFIPEDNMQIDNITLTNPCGLAQGSVMKTFEISR